MVCANSQILNLFINSDDAEKMFEEAKVVSPNKKATITSAASSSSSKYWIGRKSSLSGSSSGSHPAETCDCEICFLTLPRAVST